MATVIGTLRRKLLAPRLESVRFATRGFPSAASSAAAELERIPQSVICGFEWGIETTDLAELERRLGMVDAELRGFAYEGATMAWTILDALPGGRGDRTQRLLSGPGRRHLFLAYIGIGFAMARLPRALWRTVLPDLPGVPYHPTMSWLAVDGYGFDKAYFDTRRWVEQQRRPEPYPWENAPGYFPRAVDQGIGRALWFIHGADPTAVTEAVHRFDSDRWADLFSGVGLAAAFAGGSGADGLAALAAAAGGHRPDVALGVVFAAKARGYAGTVPEHTELAARVLADMTVADAVALADATEVAAGAVAAGADVTAGAVTDATVTAATVTAESDSVPAYELWRNAIRSRLAGAISNV